jgi:hypothetical protein
MEVTKMNFDEEMDMEPIIDVPASPVLGHEKSSPYGSVPGLEDEELADPAELERCAFEEQWGPVLSLPERHQGSGFRPDVDEFGHLEGAFGSVDFQRMYPFDKARYKADRLAEELRYSLIRLDSAMERVPGPAKYEVLRYLHQDVIDFDDIEDENMRWIARWDSRARRLKEEIQSLREYSWRRRHSDTEDE